MAEDDASLGEGIQTALKRAAFAVDWVKDGFAALAAINDGNIDLVVLDLGLPRMDGIEVIRQVRASGGSVPILVLSARERSADRTLGLDVGADDYLGKPIDTAEQLARVRAL
ncbi:MAG TPA: response regulator, partial [Burkholderiaceae bacterium]|nr:response regulator [Burkholderiaceae bacterium]